MLNSIFIGKIVIQKKIKLFYNSDKCDAYQYISLFKSWVFPKKNKNISINVQDEYNIKPLLKLLS